MPSSARPTAPVRRRGGAPAARRGDDLGDAAAHLSGADDQHRLEPRCHGTGNYRGSTRWNDDDPAGARRRAGLERRAPGAGVGVQARWTVRSALRRAVEVLRDEGPRVLWFKVLGETVYRRLTLVELSLASPPPLREPAIALTYGFVEAGPDTLPELRGDLTPAEIEHRLARGTAASSRGTRGGSSPHAGSPPGAPGSSISAATSISSRGRRTSTRRTPWPSTAGCPSRAPRALAWRSCSPRRGCTGFRRDRAGESSGLADSREDGVPRGGPHRLRRFGPWRHDFTRRRP